MWDCDLIKTVCKKTSGLMRKPVCQKHYAMKNPVCHYFFNGLLTRLEKAAKLHAEN